MEGGGGNSMIWPIIQEQDWRITSNHVTDTPSGALAGAGVLYGMTPARLHSNLGVTMVMGRTGRGQAFGIEFVSTFVLVFAYFASCEPTSWRFKPLPVGLAIAAGTVFGVSDSLPMGLRVHERVDVCLFACLFVCLLKYMCACLSCFLLFIW